AGCSGYVSTKRGAKPPRRGPIVRPRCLALILGKGRTYCLSGRDIHAVSKREHRGGPRSRLRGRGRRRWGGRPRVDDHVMHDGSIARAHLVRLNPLVLGETGGHLEILVRDRATRGYRIVLLHRQHDIGLVDSPSF